MTSSNPNSTIVPEWVPVFIEMLKRGHSMRSAVERAGINICVAYAYARRCRAFHKEWKDAAYIGTRLLEDEAVRRAYHGLDEPVVYKGKVVETWVDDDGNIVIGGTPGAHLVPLMLKKYSDAMLMFLLKARRPEVYDRASKAATAIGVDVMRANAEMAATIRDMVERGELGYIRGERAPALPGPFGAGGHEREVGAAPAPTPPE